MLLNDTIYLMDESVKKLSDIRDIQKQRSTPSIWDVLTPDRQNELLATLDATKQQLKFFLQEADEMMHMFAYISVPIKDPFLSPEIISRVSEMLNYFLDYLTGKKSADLKVMSTGCVYQNR